MLLWKPEKCTSRDFVYLTKISLTSFRPLPNVDQENTGRNAFFKELLYSVISGALLSMEKHS